VVPEMYSHATAKEANFQITGNSGISGLFSGYAHLLFSFCIETLCFATKYLLVGLENWLLSVN